MDQLTLAQAAAAHREVARLRNLLTEAQVALNAALLIPEGGLCAPDDAQGHAQDCRECFDRAVSDACTKAEIVARRLEDLQFNCSV